MTHGIRYFVADKSTEQAKSARLRHGEYVGNLEARRLDALAGTLALYFHLAEGLGVFALTVGELPRIKLQSQNKGVHKLHFQSSCRRRRSATRLSLYASISTTSKMSHRSSSPSVSCNAAANSGFADITAPMVAGTLTYSASPAVVGS